MKKYQPPIFTVSIGNIQVGGTGKTPHVEYLAELFKKEKIAVLSRGYGRSTSGFLKADETSKPETIGDEPFQIYQKFKHTLSVFVSESRPKGVLELLKSEHPNVLLLDDAYQHQYIKRDINLLLTTYDQPFSKDFLLPVGKLRENRFGAKRADGVIVTKCPTHLCNETKLLLKRQLTNYLQEGTSIFYSRFQYAEPVGYDGQLFDSLVEIILISGIGIPQILEKYCRTAFNVTQCFHFKDHHKYSREELNVIILTNLKAQFLTTEKDFVKIKDLLTDQEIKKFYYLPVKVEFEEPESFNSFLLERFKKYQSG